MRTVISLCIVFASLVHALLQLMAVPCLVLAFMAVWDYKALRADNSGQPRPVPHFYSIHSWLGLGALGMFAIQVNNCRK